MSKNVIDVTFVSEAIMPNLINAKTNLSNYYVLAKDVKDIPNDFVYKSEFNDFVNDIKFYFDYLDDIYEGFSEALKLVCNSPVDSPVFKDVIINTPDKRATMFEKGLSTIGQGGAAITEGLVWSVENAGKGLMTLGSLLMSPYAILVDCVGSSLGADIHAYKSLWEYEAPVLEHDFTKDYHDWYYSNENTQLMNEYSSFSNDSITYETLKTGGKIMGTMIMAYYSSSIAGAATPSAISSVTVFGTPLTTVLTSAGTGFITGVGESITPEMNKNYIVFDYGGEEQTFDISLEKMKEINNLKNHQSTSITQTYARNDGSLYQVNFYVQKLDDKYYLFDENGNKYEIKSIQEQDINKALLASNLQGIYSGVSYGLGALVNNMQFAKIIPESFSPFVKEVLKSSCRVAIDGATGAVDPLARAAIDSMVYGKNFEQSFEEQGGFGGMYESAVTSMAFSAASEISVLGPKHTVLKVEEKVKSGLEIDKSLQSSLKHLTVGDLQQIINDATEKGILEDILPYLDKSKVTSKKVLRMLNAEAKQTIGSYYSTDPKVTDTSSSVKLPSYDTKETIGLDVLKPSNETKVTDVKTPETKSSKSSDLDYGGNKYTYKSTDSPYSIEVEVSTDAKITKPSDLNFDSSKYTYKSTNTSGIPRQTSANGDYKVESSSQSKVSDLKPTVDSKVESFPTNSKILNDISMANYYIQKGNFYVLNFANEGELPDINHFFWKSIDDPTKLYINLNGNRMTLNQAYEYKKSSMQRIKTNADVDINNTSANVDNHSKSPIELNDISMANYYIQKGNFCVLKFANESELPDINHNFWTSINEKVMINLNGNLMSVDDAFKLKQECMQRISNNVKSDLSIEDLKYNGQNKAKYALDYLMSNLHKFVYVDTNNIDGVNKSIMEKGLYHFTSEDSVDAILNSGYIKSSGYNASYGNKKSFFFNGIPSVGEFASNLDMLPLRTVAVKVEPDIETINSSRLKIRSLDDGAITYDGNFSLSNSKASKEYFCLFLEGDELVYKSVSKTFYDNYMNTEQGKNLSKFLENKKNILDIKSDYYNDLYQKSKSVKFFSTLDSKKESSSKSSDGTLRVSDDYNKAFTNEGQNYDYKATNVETNFHSKPLNESDVAASGYDNGGSGIRQYQSTSTKENNASSVESLETKPKYTEVKLADVNSKVSASKISGDDAQVGKNVELNKTVTKDSYNKTVDLSKTSISSKKVDSNNSMQESKQHNTIISKFKDSLSGVVDKVKEINYYRNQREKLSSAQRFDNDFDIVSYFNDGGQYLYHNLRSYYNMHKDDPNIEMLFDKYNNLPNYKKSVDEILKDFAWLHSIDSSHDGFLNQVVDGLHSIALNSNNFNDNYISNFDYGLLDEGYMYSRVTGPIIGAYERGQGIVFKVNSSNKSSFYAGDREIAQANYNAAVKQLKYEVDAAVYLNMLTDYSDKSFLSGASSIDQAVANIDSLINQSPRLKEDIVLYRGASGIFCDNNQIDITSLKPGQIINDKATVSTSLLKSKAYGNDVLLEILAPKGSKALYLESMVKGYGQQEVLLPRDTHFRVISEPTIEEYVVNGETKLRTVIKVEIVPEEEVKSLKIQNKKNNNKVINNQTINKDVSSSNNGKNVSNVIDDFNVLFRGDSNITYDSYNRLFNSNSDGVSLNQFFDKMNRNGLISKYEDSIVDIDYLYKGGEGPGVIHHDVSHVERVMLNAIYMGNELNITEGEMNLLIDAAKYHDVGVYAGHDYHAQRSAKAVGDNLSGKYMDSDLRMIQAIVEYHELNDGQANFNMIIQKYHIESENVETVLKLSNILKDADAIDRTRFMRNLDTRYFRNKEVANSLVKTSYQMQEMIAKQKLDSLISSRGFDKQYKRYINECRKKGVPDYVLYESFTTYNKWGRYGTPYEMISKWMGWS